MTTQQVSQIIIKAFRDAKILKMNETPQANELLDALDDLNYILGQWSAEALMVLASIMESFPLTAGKFIYTIGIGGDFNTVAPTHIDNAFIQDSLKIRYPVEITDKSIYDTYEDSQISIARPSEIIYDPGPTQALPQLGIIYTYPIVDNSGPYTLWIGQQKALSSFTNLSDTVMFHPVYFMALRMSLAESVFAKYHDDQTPVPVYIRTKLANALSTIKAMNTRPGSMVVDLGRKKGSFDIYVGPYSGGYSGT